MFKFLTKNVAIFNGFAITSLYRIKSFITRQFPRHLSLLFAYHTDKVMLCLVRLVSFLTFIIWINPVFLAL